MLLQACFKLMCSLADIQFSTGAWHFIDDVCLLLNREGVFDLSEERMDGGSGNEHCSDIQVLTHPADPLINASYIREEDSGHVNRGPAKSRPNCGQTAHTIFACMASLGHTPTCCQCKRLILACSLG